MKRYFEKKAFIWYLFFTILCGMGTLLIMSVIATVLPYGSVTREIAGQSIGCVCVPVFHLCFSFQAMSLSMKYKRSVSITANTANTVISSTR